MVFTEVHESGLIKANGSFCLDFCDSLKLVVKFFYSLAVRTTVLFSHYEVAFNTNQDWLGVLCAVG